MKISGTAAFASLVIIGFAGGLAPVNAQGLAPLGGPAPAPFTATLSNNTPLAFGMDVEEVSRVLGQKLSYISGRPGDEIYMALRNVGGFVLFYRNDRLYLQFRKGRLAGWKGDWGHNWMWQ